MQSFGRVILLLVFILVMPVYGDKISLDELVEVPEKLFSSDKEKTWSMLCQEVLELHARVVEVCNHKLLEIVKSNQTVQENCAMLKELLAMQKDSLEEIKVFMDGVKIPRKQLLHKKKTVEELLHKLS